MNSYANLGQYLKDNGFTTSKWINQSGKTVAFEFHPEFPAFDAMGRPLESSFSLRYGDGALKAKGFYDGRPHGGNTDLIQALIRHPSNPLRFDNNKSYTLTHFEDKSDLDYIPGAWKFLINSAASFGYKEDPGSGGKDDPTPLSTIDARTEELRKMAIDLFHGSKNGTLKAVGELFDDEDLWPKLKPFVVAGLKAYRKLVGG